jgi:hypothetical protein
MITKVMKKLVLMAALVGSAGVVVSAASIAYAAPAAVCFQDVRSWEAVKAQLPPFMQRNELYAVVQTRSMVGAMKIVQAGRTILMEAHGKHSLIGYIDTVDTLTQICVQGTKIKVSLAHNPSNTLEIVPNGLKTQGIVVHADERRWLRSVHRADSAAKTIS